MKSILLVTVALAAQMAGAQIVYQNNTVRLQANPSNSAEMGGALRVCTSPLSDLGLVHTQLRYRESVDPLQWVGAAAANLGCNVQSANYTSWTWDCPVGQQCRRTQLDPLAIVGPVPSPFPYTQVGDCSKPLRNVLDVVVTCSRNNGGFREFLRAAAGKPKQIRIRTSTESSCSLAVICLSDEEQ